MHNKDTSIRDKVLKLTQAQNGPAQAHRPSNERMDELVANFPVDKIVEVHEFMLDQLHKVKLCNYQKIGENVKKGELVAESPQIVTIAAQAWIGIC